MIKYALKCADDHTFETWFANSAAYDKLVEARQLFCPVCGSDKVEKALMAPSIVSKHSQTPPAHSHAEYGQMPEEAVQFARKLRALVEQHSDYVGPRFADEALKIHHEESEARSIYGEASREELSDLHEEGVAFFPLPILPEDQN